MFDGYIVKYFASVVALLVYAAPLYFRDPALRASQADLTQVPPCPRGLVPCVQDGVRRAVAQLLRLTQK